MPAVEDKQYHNEQVYVTKLGSEEKVKFMFKKLIVAHLMLLYSLTSKTQLSLSLLKFTVAQLFAKHGCYSICNTISSNRFQMIYPISVEDENYSSHHIITTDPL